MDFSKKTLTYHSDVQSLPNGSLTHHSDVQSLPSGSLKRPLDIQSLPSGSLKCKCCCECYDKVEIMPLDNMLQLYLTEDEVVDNSDAIMEKRKNMYINDIDELLKKKLMILFIDQSIYSKYLREFVQLFKRLKKKHSDFRTTNYPELGISLYLDEYHSELETIQKFLKDVKIDDNIFQVRDEFIINIIENRNKTYIINKLFYKHITAPNTIKKSCFSLATQSSSSSSSSSNNELSMNLQEIYNNELNNEYIFDKFECKYLDLVKIVSSILIQSIKKTRALNECLKTIKKKAK